MKKYIRCLAIILALAFWIGCGRITRGYWIGEFTTKYPDQEHERGARILYAFGSIGLLMAALRGDLNYPYMPHGKSCQERYDYFKSEQLRLDKNYFIHFGGNELCNAGDLK